MTAQHVETLRPCPFCGGANVYTEVVAPHTHKVAKFMPDYEGGAMVACGDCHAANWRDGANAEAEVIKLWNARAASALQGQDHNAARYVALRDELMDQNDSPRWIEFMAEDIPRTAEAFDASVDRCLRICDGVIERLAPHPHTASDQE